MKRYTTILTIAGSDSSGGAGIQADIKTATLMGIYAMSAITAVTAQNSLGVKAAEPVSPLLLRSQLEAAFADGLPDAVKIGMIPNIESAQIIAEVLKRYGAKNVVVDPVMVSTSGKALSPFNLEMAELFAEELLPLATLVTPNIPETVALLQFDDLFSTTPDLVRNHPEQTALHISYLYSVWNVLIKGGHCPNCDQSTDYLVKSTFSESGYSTDMQAFTAKRIRTHNNHGTGCVLSTAIACNLAKGLELPEAVEKAKVFLTNALRMGKDYEFGQPSGHGPLHLIK